LVFTGEIQTLLYIRLSSNFIYFFKTAHLIKKLFKILVSVWYKNLKGNHHLDDLSVERMITLKFNLKVMCEGVDWIPLVHDEDQWRTVINTILNLRIP
jgi:hypothetical protein